jgi:hypothetical protein
VGLIEVGQGGESCCGSALWGSRPLKRELTALSFVFAFLGHYQTSKWKVAALDVGVEYGCGREKREGYSMQGGDQRGSGIARRVNDLVATRATSRRYKWK